MAARKRAALNGSAVLRRCTLDCNADCASACLSRSHTRRRWIVPGEAAGGCGCGEAGVACCFGLSAAGSFACGGAADGSAEAVLPGVSGPCFNEVAALSGAVAGA